MLGNSITYVTPVAGGDKYELKGEISAALCVDCVRGELVVEASARECVVCDCDDDTTVGDRTGGADWGKFDGEPLDWPMPMTLVFPLALSPSKTRLASSSVEKLWWRAPDTPITKGATSSL